LRWSTTLVKLRHFPTMAFWQLKSLMTSPDDGYGSFCNPMVDCTCRGIRLDDAP
jgi:hypothetical protein